jgi:peptidoglycan/xylan/chitin deacetylase (PgdA/CDA1 family)
MLISARMLERHLDYLAKHFELLSLDDIASRLESGRPFRRPAAAITFDDGYSDVFRIGAPVLKRKGIPAAVFVVTGLAGTRQIPVHDRLFWLLSLLHSRGVSPARTVSRLIESGLEGRQWPGVRGRSDTPFHVMSALLQWFPQEEVERMIEQIQRSGYPIASEALDEMSPLTWEMIRRMHEDGFTIGSHTKSHVLLTAEQKDRVRRELTESRQELELRLNVPIRHFAYPDGRFNPAIVEAVHAAGYQYGYGTCRRRDRRFPLLTIPRKLLWERSCLNALGMFSPAVMLCQTHWAFDRPDRCDHNHMSAGQGPERAGQAPGMDLYGAA